VTAGLDGLVHESVSRFVESALRWVKRYAPRLGEKMERYWRRALKRGEVMRCPLAYVLWAYQYVCNAGFKFGLGEEMAPLEECLRLGSAYFEVEGPDVVLAREVYLRAHEAFRAAQAYELLRRR